VTSRWDDTAMTLIRDLASDLTALDAAVEVLNLHHPADPVVSQVDRLTKQCVRRQLDILAHLKG